jgi:hypothetical protein
MDIHMPCKAYEYMMVFVSMNREKRLLASYRWLNQSSRLHDSYPSFWRNLCNIPPLNKECTEKTNTCNRLDMETLEFGPKISHEVHERKEWPKRMTGKKINHEVLAIWVENQLEEFLLIMHIVYEKWYSNTPVGLTLNHNNYPNLSKWWQSGKRVPTYSSTNLRHCTKYLRN